MGIIKIRAVSYRLLKSEITIFEIQMKMSDKLTGPRYERRRQCPIQISDFCPFAEYPQWSQHN
jgi:hypothetical protein